MKKKIILGAASAAVILSSLTACGNKDQSSTQTSSPSSKISDSSSPSSSKTSSTSSTSSSTTTSSSSSSTSSSKSETYSAIAKPYGVRALSNEDTNKSFSWYPVSGAAGYVAKIDDGKAFEIGNNIIDDELVCYTVSTDELTDGTHTIKFATVGKDGAQSEWTDALTFTVSNVETPETPVTPIVTSDLTVSVASGKGFDKVTFDFGDGIKAETSLATAKTSQTFNVNDLGVASKLTNKEVYVVRVTVSYKGQVSEQSAPVTYTYKYEESKETKAKTPTYTKNTQTFKFDEKPSVVTVKINDKEYKTADEKLAESMTFDDLVSACGITGDAALALVDAKVSVKVNYDGNHYLASDYSKEVTATYVGEAAKESKDLFNAVSCEYDAASNKYVFSVEGKPVGTNFLTIKAYNANNKEVTVTKGTSLKSFATVDAIDVDSITYTLVYTRNNVTETKKVTDPVAKNEKTIEDLKVNLSGNNTYIIWKVFDGADDYLVELTQGTTTKKYYISDILTSSASPSSASPSKVTTLSIAASKFDVSGDFSLKVYAIKDKKVIESSVSETLNLTKLDTPKDFTVKTESKKNYITLSKDMIVLTKTTKEAEPTVYINSSEQIAIDSLYSIEVYYVGNGLNAIDSSHKVYYFTERNLEKKYHFEDNQYIVLDVDYVTFKDVLGTNEKNYLTTDGTKFDFMSYMFNTNKTSLSLTKDESTTLVNNVLTFDNLDDEVKENFSVSATIDWSEKITDYVVSFGKLTKEATTNKQTFTISALDKLDGKVADNCKFELEVIKLITTTSADKTKTTTEEIKSKSTVSAGNYYIDSIKEAGTYIIRVRVAGNGVELSGKALDKELTLSDSGEWKETTTYDKSLKY